MTPPLSILVVHGDPRQLEEVCAELRAGDCRLRTARDGAQGWSQFQKERPDLVISDVGTPGGGAVELLRRIRDVSDVPVLVLTERGALELVAAALREGASDFVRLPVERKELTRRVQALLPTRRVTEPDDAARSWIRGDTPIVFEVRNRVRALAGLEVPVLVSGESGSGRLDAVRALHALSGERAPLVEIRASDRALPEQPCAAVLVELARWPREAQDFWAAALRAEGAARVARLFATAEPTLAARVDRLEFRRDLWKQVSRFRVEIPPLRARAQDIPLFAREALAEIAASLGRSGLYFTAGALDSLRKRPWPGNFPELREVLVQAVAFADGRRLDRDALDRAVRTVIAARENSLAHRRAAKHSAEREQLIQLLGTCQGNVAEIARRLGMTRGAVSYRLRKHGLTR